MSRITDMVLEPHVTYTGKTFTVKVKVQDSYFYKKYLISENIKYTTAEGTTFTLTNINATQIGSILTLTGKTKQIRIPEAFQEVEYIQSSGTQYIDTGVSPTSDTGFIIEYQEGTSTGTKTLIGSGTSTATGYIGISRNGTQVQAYWGRPNNITSYTFTYNTKHKIQFNLNSDRKVVMDGTEIYTLETTPPSTITTNTMTLCAFKFTSIVQYANALKLYNCQIYSGSTLVRSFIPCYRKSDGVIGLYDIIEKKFYTNKGTGTFTKGNDITVITPDNPLEIKTVCKDNWITISNKNWCYTNSTDWQVGQYKTDGDPQDYAPRARLKNLIPVRPNTTYYVNTNNNNYTFVLRGYDYNKNFVTNIGTKNNGTTFTTRIGSTSSTVAAGYDIYYIGVTIYNPNDGGNTVGQAIIDSIAAGTTKPLICLNIETDKTYVEHEGESHRIDLGGTNLINPNRNSYTTVGVTLTNNGDGTFTANGTATATVSLILSSNPQDYIKMETGKSYTYMVKEISGTGQGTFPMAVYKEDDTTQYNYYVLKPNENLKSITKTATENLRPREICLYTTSGKTFDNYRFAVELAEAPGEIEYSPYVENPIELGELETARDKIKQSTGKNLFDREKTTQGYVNADGTINNTISYRTSDYIPIEPNKTYTKSYTASPRTKFFNSNKQVLDSSTYQDTTTGGNAGSFTTPENAAYFRFSYPTTIAENTIQIEAGGTQTEPEPYGVGIWYKEKHTNNYTFTGTETYGVNNNWDNDSPSILHIYTNDVPNWKTGQTQFLSNLFRCTTQSGRNFAQEMITCHTTNASVYFFIDFNRLSGVSSTSTAAEKIAAFKTWIQSNSTQIEYQLATTEYEDITSTETQNQLNQIQNLIMQENETNIDWNGEITPTMLLQYATNEELHANIITEDGTKIRTDWR